MANSVSADGVLPAIIIIDTDPGVDYFTFPIELLPKQSANVRVIVDTPSGVVTLQEDFWDYASDGWANNYTAVETWISTADQKIYDSEERTRIRIGMVDGDYTSGTFTCHLGTNAVHPQLK